MPLETQDTDVQASERSGAESRTGLSAVPTTSMLQKRPSYQAFQTLYFGFTILPIVAGVDKFTHLLVNWDQYLSSFVARIVPMSAHTFMLMVGVIEILAGILVAIKPRVGATIVAFWLWGIIANLALIPGYFDIALRDFGLSLGALALARLSKEFDVD